MTTVWANETIFHDTICRHLSKQFHYCPFFFLTKIEFPNAVKCRWVLEVKYVLQRVHGGALLGVQEVKPLKNGGLFTSGEQINNLK